MDSSRGVHGANCRSVSSSSCLGQLSVFRGNFLSSEKSCLFFVSFPARHDSQFLVLRIVHTAVWSPLIRVFHNSPTTHHNPPQLTTTVVGELWVSCGELWWACHNSPQNGWQLWQGILWPPQVATICPQLPPQRATTCHNIPPFNHILPQFYHILPHFTTISMRFASFHSIIIINYA